MPRLRGCHDEPREILEAPPGLLAAQVLRSVPHRLADGGAAVAVRSQRADQVLVPLRPPDP
jgi:hypothetical protein